MDNDTYQKQKGPLETLFDRFGYLHLRFETLFLQAIACQGSVLIIVNITRWIKALKEGKGTTLTLTRSKG